MNRKPDQEVVAALTLVRLCQNFRTLPGSGGLLDQDAFHVYLMELVALADQRRMEIDNARAKTQMH